MVVLYNIDKLYKAGMFYISEGGSCIKWKVQNQFTFLRFLSFATKERPLQCGVTFYGNRG